MILADPPWRFTAYSPKGQAKSPDQHYGTMTIDAICRLPVHNIAASHCGLALWAYGPRLPEAFKVINAWGFTYKSDLLTWVKITRRGKLAFGTGYSTRKCTEQLLYATRGDGLKVLDRGVRQAVFAERREHSRKPDEAAEALERLFGPVRRAELFARERRANWVAWGNQLPE